MQSLPVIEPLCGAGGHTCSACCYGDRVTRGQLDTALERQTTLFRSLIREKPPTRFAAMLVELRARGLVGFLWALLLVVPFVGPVCRPWLKRRVACAFLGYLEDSRERVGCLLHPSRFDGKDLRSRLAFPFWRGFGCGDAVWRCLPAWRWLRATPLERRAWLRNTKGMDWFTYGAAVKSRW